MATHSSLQSDSTTDLNPGGKPEEVQFAPSVENGMSRASTTSTSEKEMTSSHQNTNDFAQATGNSGHWSRFLVMEPIGNKEALAAQSIFLLRKVLQGLTGPSTKADKLQSGLLLIEVGQKAYADTLTDTNFLDTASLNIPVRVSPHRSLNSTRGTVYIPKYTGEQVCDILTEVQSQGVTEISRVNIRNKPSPLLKLKFNIPTLPSHIKIGYRRFEVRPDYPNPQRCFQCQKYSHSEKTCGRSKSVCQMWTNF